MSVIETRKAGLLHFFRSGPTPCPYLPGRIERKLFTRIGEDDIAHFNGRLTEAGFRRSHDIVYRPVCPACQACLPVRIPVGRLTWTRSLKRVWRRNDDLRIERRDAAATAEHFALFERYQSARHGESEMARMSFADYAAMVEEGASTAALFDARDREGRLIGTMLTDEIENGYSAVYSFFEPHPADRSLGTFLILALVEEARLRGLGHVYLGYWIKASPKMAYKARFRPLEILGPQGWRPDPDAS